MARGDISRDTISLLSITYQSKFDVSIHLEVIRGRNDVEKILLGSHVARVHHQKVAWARAEPFAHLLIWPPGLDGLEVGPVWYIADLGRVNADSLDVLAEGTADDDHVIRKLISQVLERTTESKRDTLLQHPDRLSGVGWEVLNKNDQLPRLEPNDRRSKRGLNGR
jgi:hypothetical protein